MVFFLSLISHPSLSHQRLCHNMKKPTLWKRGEAVGWKRFSAVTFKRSDSGVPRDMNPFGFMQATIAHNVKDPHSKALEPDCLFPPIVITTQSPRGKGIFFFRLLPFVL